MTFKISSLETLVSLDVAKLFWDASFKSRDLQLNIVINDKERMWEVHLTNCREEAICNLNTFVRNSKLPSIFKTTITENIFLLHQAYHQLFLWKESYDPCNKIDLLQKGELYAPNYFTVEGEFNDFYWTKRFVCDPHYNLIDRFSLSCCYWLEEESKNLWLELKQIYGADIGKNLSFLSIFEHNLALISSRVFQLEDQITKLPQSWRRRENFWMLGFEISVENGYEHAVYYFWEKLSERNRTFLYQTHKLFELMSKGITFPRDKITYFLFSQLTNEEKDNLLEWTIHKYKYEIWHTLLLSPCSKAIRDEIFSFYDELPSEMYSDLLTALADRINALQLPYDIDIFPILWNKPRPEERYFILESGADFIQILAIAKSFNNLKCVIKSLSREQKTNCLLRNQYETGITIVDILCKDGEFDMLQNYLTFFLMESDLSSGKEVLSRDARLILENFIESLDFKRWRRSKTFKKNKIEILRRIETLQISLTLLQELCEAVESEMDIIQN